jgi:ribulose bisphosphate carboxylase small subunit
LTRKKSLEAGIISFKNLKSGLLKVNLSSKLRSSDHDITEKKLEEFIEQIKYLLQEIYNPEVSFKEPKTHILFIG